MHYILDELIVARSVQTAWGLTGKHGFVNLPLLAFLLSSSSARGSSSLLCYPNPHRLHLLHVHALYRRHSLCLYLHCCIFFLLYPLILYLLISLDSRAVSSHIIFFSYCDFLYRYLLKLYLLVLLSSRLVSSHIVIFLSKYCLYLLWLYFRSVDLITSYQHSSDLFKKSWGKMFIL